MEKAGYDRYLLSNLSTVGEIKIFFKKKTNSDGNNNNDGNSNNSWPEKCRKCRDRDQDPVAGYAGGMGYGSRSGNRHEMVPFCLFPNIATPDPETNNSFFFPRPCLRLKNVVDAYSL